MSDQCDIFLGLSSTAWTAISSIATSGALILALYFPISEKISRRYKIYNNIEKEIKKNFQLLIKAESSKASELQAQIVPRYRIVSSMLEWINIDYWNENKQYISECSSKKYDEYNDINTSLSELKMYANEIQAKQGNTGYIVAIESALTTIYQKIDKFDKYK